MKDSLLTRLAEGIRCVHAEDTQSLGAELARTLPADSWIALRGDLGAGKTTLVRGLALELGIQHPITSPTYTIFNLHQGHKQLMHMDAYRLSGAGSMDALMLEDFLLSPFIAVVEWPDNIAAWLPADTLWLDIVIESDQQTRTVRSIHPPPHH